MPSSYEHLVALCALPPDFNAYAPQPDPCNARVRYLLRALSDMGAFYDVDTFDASGCGSLAEDIPRFVNVMAVVPAGDPKSTKSVVWLAHHDVHSPQYVNANDNSASCAHLLELLERLMADVPPHHTTYIVFTDAEEIVSYTRSGARRLADRIREGHLGDVACCINLELTGVDQALYSDGSVPGLTQVAGVPVPTLRTPFNDATVLRHFGVPAAVVGTLPEAELTQLQRLPVHFHTWARCHQPTDTLERISPADMAYNTNQLERIARSIVRIPEQPWVTVPKSVATPGFC